MDEFDIPVTGLAQLEAKLLDLGRNGGRRSLSKGLRAGANVIAVDAKVRVRKKSHKTEKSIRVKNQGLSFEDLTFSIVAGGAARFLERGTSRMPAYPFLRPATENKAGEAVTEMRDVTLTAIGDEWSKS
jgi:HK97 gp10 family phage protein